MNYIELINRLWQSHEAEQLSTTEIALYFYLVKIFNSCHWADSIKRLNVKINADLNITYPTMCKARNRLKQVGLIDFKTQNGNSNTTYTLKKFLKVTNEVSDEVTTEVTNEVSDEINKTKTKQNKTREIEAKASLSNTSTQGDIPDDIISEPLGNAPKDPEEEKKESCAKENREYCQKVVDYFNKKCVSLPRVQVLTDDRIRTIIARTREHGKDKVKRAIDQASISEFLAGQNKRGFSADLNWIFKPRNFIKVLEGNYGKNNNSSTSSATSSTELLQAVAEGLSRARTKQEWE